MAEVDQWQGELESVFARVAGRFARADLRRRMRDWNEAGVWQRLHEVLLAN
jgi:hypothetical protein